MLQTPNFVDREEAIQLFEDLLQFTSNGEHPAGKPFLHFWGMGGIGKTSLLDHLRKNYPNIPCVDITLDPKRKYSSESIFDEIIEKKLYREILQKLCPNDTTPFNTYRKKCDEWIEKLYDSNLQGIELQERIRKHITYVFWDIIEEIRQRNPGPILIIVDAYEYLEQIAFEYARLLINLGSLVIPVMSQEC